MVERARSRLRILKQSSPSLLRILALGLPLLIGDSSLLLARSWSYHYTPRESQPSTAASATPAEETPTFSTPRLFKEAIVSDLALYAQNPRNEGSHGFDEHSQYVVSRLLPFDHMNSPEALAVLASLNSYYLGARGEQAYNCLLLRKGKQIKPYLTQNAGSPNLECSRELGAGFEQPSAALGGLALCSSAQEQSRRLSNFIYEIDSSKPCSDEELRAITQNAPPSFRSGN